MAGRPEKPSEVWYEKAAEMVVRQGLSLRQAAAELGVAITSEEAEAISKRKVFQRVLWTKRNEYFNEIANEPGRTKSSALGLLVFLAQKLIEEGNYDKAAEVIYKLMRAEGWVGNENAVNVFANVSVEEIAAAKKRLEEQLERERRPSAERTSTAPVN